MVAPGPASVVWTIPGSQKEDWDLCWAQLTSREPCSPSSYLTLLFVPALEFKYLGLGIYCFSFSAGLCLSRPLACSLPPKPSTSCSLSLCNSFLVSASRTLVFLFPLSLFSYLCFSSLDFLKAFPSGLWVSLVHSQQYGGPGLCPSEAQDSRPSPLFLLLA